VEDPVKVGPQEKVESSQLGRAAITGALIFILGSLAAANIPTSYLQLKLNSIVEPVRDSVGLDQTWSVFAPDPRQQTFGLEARITYDDGGAETWVVPTGDPFVAEYRTYHWQKWAEFARADDTQVLWGPLAVWLARTHNGPTRHPAVVTLIRRWYDLNPPGSHPSRGPWHEYTYFSVRITPAILGGES
jgi:hypothetical protein